MPTENIDKLDFVIHYLLTLDITITNDIQP